MSKQRTVRVECGKPTQMNYVTGTELSIDVYKPSPPKSQLYEIRSSPGIKCSILDQQLITPVTESASKFVLHKGTILLVTQDKTSKDVNDNKVTVTFYEDKSDNPIDKMTLQFTAVSTSLDVDADRDGKVEENHPNKASWSWGPNGHGAVLLVNCDKDDAFSSKPDNTDNLVNRLSDLKDMSCMILRTKGPQTLQSGCKLQLYISASDRYKVRVFLRKEGRLLHVLGDQKLSFVTNYKFGKKEYDFFVEGLRFPDKDFDGLVTINLSLLESMTVGEAPIFTDRVVFRMAPWIMTPNTLAPEEVFVCSVAGNEKFLKEFKALVAKVKCKLTVCPEYVNRGDRWIQDEIEFGYIEAPHKYFPVVLDSPRDRELKDFPHKKILGPDFGHVTKTSDEVNSLDSFGNLEVSPPVTVNGKEYPMGRIIIGSAFPTTSDGRNMAKVIRDFLYAQQVQSPVELFSDWLVVGHVDEFMTFIPAPDRKGFRLVLCSPDACCKLFKKLEQEGHGEAQMFEGQNAQPFKINELLSNQKLLDDNIYVQQCIDWNRDVLKKELGLDEGDIIDIPVLFTLHQKYGKAMSFFPDMEGLPGISRWAGDSIFFVVLACNNFKISQSGTDRSIFENAT
ncbi:protein-arginine deiminase type-2-like isoform X2 [Carcharodon carcharias]|uniref:protein-arginine deiminase type-2-like isoform X2 n=1 Tax=Carcharodon carcharias TaxID=13397 RepID=UPI001B7E72F4|nr:protein-arginine deiminase type-2-like isoform X2 [Carcharodon carcharias]